MIRRAGNLRDALLVILGLAVISCSNRLEGEQVLTPEKFEEVYVALLEQAVSGKNAPADSAKTFDRDAILNTYGTSKKQYQLTVATYNQEYTKWREFFNEVTKRLDQNLKQEGSRRKP
jgi:hypothetical protein